MQKGYSVGGIQQVGIGVANLTSRWEETRANFGFDTIIFREHAQAKLMTRYTRDIVESREAMMVLNLFGGGGFEIWQYVSRVSHRKKKHALPGDLGIYAVKLYSANIEEAHCHLSKSSSVLCADITRKNGTPSFFCRDRDDNIFQVVKGDPVLYHNLHPVGGVAGVIIGCSNIDATLPLYTTLLGYTVITDDTQTFPPSSFLMQSDMGESNMDSSASARTIRTVKLASPQDACSPFSALCGTSIIELWQMLPHGASAESHLFYERQWGDVGFIHLCFEVMGMDALKESAREMGIHFTVDSGNTFSMGEAGGRFAYVEDPDGTLIEFVETHRVRLLKYPPLFINMSRRTTPLPPLVLRALILKRSRA